jgi:hypothetical protein
MAEAREKYLHDDFTKLLFIEGILVENDEI